MNKKQELQFDKKFKCFPGGIYLQNDKPCQENDIKQFISTLLKQERQSKINTSMKKLNNKKRKE